MAIEKYGHALAYERAEIVRAHRAEQVRLATSIPAPSPELSAVPVEPVGKTVEVLQHDPRIAVELTALVEAGRLRLSAEDLREPGRVPDTYRQATILQDIYMQHLRQQTRGRDIVPTLAR